MKDNQLDQMIREYESIQIPEELKQRVELGIEQAKMDTHINEQKVSRFPFRAKIGFGFVAAMVTFIVVINVNSNIAYAMSNIPVLGTIVKIITFTTYEDSENDMSARVNVPKIKITGEKDMTKEEKELNKTIKEYTDQIIQQYENYLKEYNGEGKEDLTTEYQVVTDNNQLFSVRFDTVILLGSSDVKIKIYHIDKSNGQMVELNDICKTDIDYKTKVSEEIKRQMREQMRLDENIRYMIDDTDMPELNWTGITDETNFYINNDGKLVIVFDKYEVAPGYMGSCEFVMPMELTNDILMDRYIK